MKKGITATAVITVILIIAACVCRASFTHYDSLTPFKVALLNDDMLEMIRSSVIGATGRSRNVVKVKCTSEVQLAEKVSMQSAEVVRVFKGSDVKEGDEILIMPYSSWIFEEFGSINMGFVNAMIPGDEYLAFLEPPIKVVDKDLTVYKTTESLVCTVFSYKEHDNVIPGIKENEIEYSVVKNNEFFVNSKEMDDMMKSLKAEIMQKYQD